MTPEIDDLTSRLLTHIDQLYSKLNDTCDRFINVEMQLEANFKDIDDRTANKEKKFYIIIAGMGIVFTLIEILQGDIPWL